MTFPPAFKELPKDVNAKVRATGQIIELNQELQEYATWWSNDEVSEFGERDTVRNNFWEYFGAKIDKVSFFVLRIFHNFCFFRNTA